MRSKSCEIAPESEMQRRSTTWRNFANLRGEIRKEIRQTTKTTFKPQTGNWRRPKSNLFQSAVVSDWIIALFEARDCIVKQTKLIAPWLIPQKVTLRPNYSHSINYPHTSTSSKEVSNQVSVIYSCGRRKHPFRNRNEKSAPPKVVVIEVLINIRMSRSDPFFISFFHNANLFIAYTRTFGILHTVSGQISPPPRT